MKRLFFLFMLLLFPALLSAQCGKWRWDIKTASDLDSLQLSKFDTVFCSTPLLCEIDKRFRIKSSRYNKSFRYPEERKIFILEIKNFTITHEADSDTKIRFYDSSYKRFIYFELPDTLCIDNSKSYQRKCFSESIQNIRRCETSSTAKKIRIHGIGFFDFEHGKTKKLRIFFELHPILKVEILD